MKPIHLIPLVLGQGSVAPPRFDDLEYLAATLARTFQTPCRIRPETLDVGFAFDERRRQYYSMASSSGWNGNPTRTPGC